MTSKVPMEFTEHAQAVMKIMAESGLLLAAWKTPDYADANAMVIGWGAIGAIWGKPVWQVMVRPSRYTFELIEHYQTFSVNVLTPNHTAALELCGSVSGRGRNKLEEAYLTAVKGRAGTPIIVESAIHYECRVIHKNDVLAENLNLEIQKSYYPSKDYHRVYWGEILSAECEPAFMELLERS